MAKRISSPHAAAISSEEALTSRLSQRSPDSGRISAPIFSTTFGQPASSGRWRRHKARTSSARPRYGPPAIGTHEVVGDDRSPPGTPAPARSARAICVWYTIASKERPRPPSVRTPARKLALAQHPRPSGVVPHRRRHPRRWCGAPRGTVRGRPPRAPRARRRPRRPASDRRGRRCPRSRGPGVPALFSAASATNSTSPTGRSSAGPSLRYSAWHSTNTVRARCGRCRVGPQVVDRVREAGVARVEPEVMVGIADRQLRLQDRLRGPLAGPVGLLAGHTATLRHHRVAVHRTWRALPNARPHALPNAIGLCGVPGGGNGRT